ncbi:hypothetical protein C1H46_026758 [Malus baccata]|uniref:Uncharacterized protein n=1 Tax=Malus baccata TaxID=106549 RepID=A0A540LMI1_MALBA|nr:hypothetical protein C1H46_026758 [Malus baccata]
MMTMTSHGFLGPSPQRTDWRRFFLVYALGISKREGWGRNYRGKKEGGERLGRLVADNVLKFASQRNSGKAAEAALAVDAQLTPRPSGQQQKQLMDPYLPNSRSLSLKRFLEKRKESGRGRRAWQESSSPRRSNALQFLVDANIVDKE